MINLLLGLTVLLRRLIVSLAVRVFRWGLRNDPDLYRAFHYTLAVAVQVEGARLLPGVPPGAIHNAGANAAELFLSHWIKENNPYKKGL